MRRNMKRLATIATAAIMMKTAGAMAMTHDRNYYKHVDVDGVKIAYREAGDKHAPTLLLLHGFPTSSHMYRTLIPLLADQYHVIAPDYPGFGESDAPAPEKYTYSFDQLAKTMTLFTQKLGLNHYSLYLQDYGAPVGLRMANAEPEKVQALIIQNGNAYEEGLSPAANGFMATDFTKVNPEAFPLFTLEATKEQFLQGARHPDKIDPQSYLHAQAGMDRPGNKAIQMKLAMDYKNNPPLYLVWQHYFRTHQPPALIVWGKGDFIFTVEGALAYQRDLKDSEVHLLEGSHFVLEERAEDVAFYIKRFLKERGI